MNEKLLNLLKKSYEEGFITTEEYEAQKKVIEEMKEEPMKEESEARNEHAEEIKQDAPLKSDRTLLVAIILLLIGVAAVFGAKYFFKAEPLTIDDLHALNFKGKLKEEQGYLYKEIYSFVKFDDLWYTQLKSPKGTRLYNIQFRYGPKEVEEVKVEGILDTGLFDNAQDYYVTFNPTGNDFSSVALAVGDFNQQMTNIFFKQPIAACDRNETRACIDRQVITCKDTDKLVLYVKESNTSRVLYDDNCITIEGSGFDLVKGIDRVLYEFYGIMEQ
ncbi:MAG: hypothetical protein AABX34_00560 [Nanoarchaeota archaeon]